MQFDLEILIPIRNATEVFARTIESLAAQTERRFTVLISDNFSTSGGEHLEQALARLAAAGIPARRIRPPSELGRVEHWNWLHYQSAAMWLKPLFAGDWLEPDYIAAVREVCAREPRCAYVYCGFHHHQGGQSHSAAPAYSGRFFTAPEMQEIVLRYAMQFGPPSAAAYRHDAFLKSGGYDPRLPICADSLLFCKLAARHGAWGLERPLAHFLIHAARFSDSLGAKRRETFRENLCYMAELGITARHERWRFPVAGYARLFARHFFHHWKGR